MKRIAGVFSVFVLLCSLVLLCNCGRDESAPQISSSPDVVRLIGLLDSGTKSQKLEAMEEIKKLGLGAKAAIPALIRAARSSDVITSLSAGKALESMGGEAARAILREDEISTSLMLTLTKIGKPAIPYILEACRNQPIEKKMMLLLHIGMMEKKALSAVPELERMAASASEAESDIIKSVIVQIKEGRAGLDRRLRESDAELADLDRKSEKASRRLHDAAKDIINPKMTINAVPEADRFIKFIRGEPNAIELAAAKLSESEPEKRGIGLVTLYRMAESGDVDKAKAVAHIESMLRDEMVVMRAFAAAMMVKLGEAEKAAPTLIKLLADETPDPQGIMIAVISLAEGKVTVKDSEALAMLKAMSSKALGNPELSAAAMVVLINSGMEEDVLPEISLLLASPLSEKRKIGAALACKLGPKAKSIAPDLREALRNETDNEIKDFIDIAIGTLGRVEDDAETLISEFESGKGSALYGTMKKICGLGTDGKKSILSRLAIMLNTTEGTKRSMVVWAICDGCAEIDEAFPLIKAIMEHAIRENSRDNMFRAVEALGKSGKSEAAPLLARAMKSRHEGVANSAGIGLRNLGTKASGVIDDLIQTAVEYPETRSSVLLTLPDLGKLKKDSQVERLIGLVDELEGSEAASIVFVVEKMGGMKMAIPLLAPRLESSKKEARFAALLAMEMAADRHPECSDDALNALSNAASRVSDQKFAERMKGIVKKHRDRKKQE
jgi:hypothetical protein